MKKKVIAITGASGGIGQAAAREFLRHGHVVYNLSRNEAKLSSVNEKGAGCSTKFIKTDVTNVDEIAAALKAIVDAEGRIDILINNAGFGISGSAEGTSAADIILLLDVNFVGLTRCCSAVLPYMRAQKSGKIINISSLAAAYPLSFQSFYSASKAAVTASTWALRTEIAPFRVKACSVMLGDVKTGFTASRQKNSEDIDAYSRSLIQAIKTYERDELKRGAPPEAIAKGLYRISRRRSPKPIIVIGLKSKLLVFFTRFFPVRFVNWIIGKKY